MEEFLHIHLLPKFPTYYIFPYLFYSLIPFLSFPNSCCQLLFSLCVCICIYIPFIFLRVSCTHDASFPWVLQCAFPKIKDIILHSKLSQYSYQIKLVWYYYLICRSYSYLPVVSRMSCTTKEYELCSGFSYPVSLICFNLEQFLNLPCFSWPDNLKSLGQLFCWMSFSLDLFDRFFVIIFALYTFVVNTKHTRCFWRHMLSVCPIYGDVSFDHLVKIVSVRLLYCKVTIFPFVIYG